MIYVAYKKLRGDAALPTYATDGSVGADLAIPLEGSITLCRGAVTPVATGVALSIPRGFEGQIRSRSGLASRGVWVANGVGTIDWDYRGEIVVLLYNSTPYDIELAGGSRVAQIVFNQVDIANFTPWAAQDDIPTKRGAGGFGSTGA